MGGLEQAKAISLASFSPSKIRATAGVANLLLSAPVWMQMVHLLLADALWISLVLLCAGTLEPDGVLADKSV